MFGKLEQYWCFEAALSDDFDPYYRWLGIPPGEQPPNLYALLGVAKFESNPEVIRNAAFQRITFLKVLMSGKLAGLAEKLHKEIIEARETLLDAERRQTCDRTLREESAATDEPQAPTIAARPPSPAVEAPAAEPMPIVAVSPARGVRRRRRGRWLGHLIGIIGGGAIGIAIGVAALWFGFGVDVLGVMSKLPRWSREKSQPLATSPRQPREPSRIDAQSPAGNDTHVTSVQPELASPPSSEDASEAAVQTTAPQPPADPVGMLSTRLETLRQKQPSLDAIAAPAFLLEVAAFVDLAIAADDLTAARSAATAGEAAADHFLPSKAPSARALSAKVDRLTAQYELCRGALERWRGNPQDLEAASIVGTYYCLAKDDWAKGLPLLSQGADEELRRLAALELLDPKTPEDCYQLGELWCDLATERRDWREPMRERGAFWYGRQYGVLPPDERTRVNRRLGTLPNCFATYQCQFNGASAEIMPDPKGFCFLTAIQGALEGGGEAIELSLDKRDVWVFRGHTAQPLSATAFAYKSPRRRLFDTRVEEIAWKYGESAQSLLKTSEGVCLFVQVGGSFAGDSEQIYVSPHDDGYWYFDVVSHQVVGARAAILRFANSPEDRVEVKEYRWSAGQPPVRMIHHRDGFCYLSGIGGAFQGTGEAVAVEIYDRDGYWYLRGHSAQASLHARAISVRFFDEP